MRHTPRNGYCATVILWRVLLLSSLVQAHAALADTKGPRVLEVVPGTSTVVNVSARMVNELIVPYRHPRLVKFQRPDSTAAIDQDGSSVYVSTGTEEFVQLIIKDGDAPDQPGISLTLDPVEDIPAQHIRLQPTGTPFVQDGGAQRSGLASADYEDMLRELIREAARDRVPAGYTEDPSWSGTRLQVGTVIGEPLKRLSGTNLVIEYFVLKNIGASRVELVEPNYTHAGVRAIAFINEVLLAPGQTSRMVWVRDR